nr:MAG TPA: hypothetical protein [Caudoviricetes sp.]
MPIFRGVTLCFIRVCHVAKKCNFLPQKVQYFLTHCFQGFYFFGLVAKKSAI